MNRFVTDKPLEIPESEGGGPGSFSRADLIFYGVDHSGPSYEARVYLDNPDADVRSERDPDAGYAGSFMVFGHDGCVGDEGHCDVEDRYEDEFDLRPPHGLTPWTKTVEVTEAMSRFEDQAEVHITVVAVAPGEEAAEESDALQFERVRLALYAD